MTGACSEGVEFHTVFHHRAEEGPVPAPEQPELDGGLDEERR